MERITTQETIMGIVSETLLISIEKLQSKNRLKQIVDARKIYAVLTKEYTGTTLSNIGRALKKHHASIIHYYREHESQMKYDAEYREKFVNCSNICQFKLKEIIDERYNPNQVVQELLEENEQLQTKVGELELLIQRIRNEVLKPNK